MREEYVTTAEAAKELGISRQSLARYVARGWLVPTRTLPSGHYRWRMSDLERQLRELRQRTDDDE
ncbi:helix-turn-helix domain-containing protein [Pseudonocardia sp. MH-G8]|uniref:helix-turn-helix domain-containing protein n=1 Tax=Pseudonocardia sp. MH-G8 TaxID=1854588 RepID=UPI001E2B7748|nr:helix-turn-helix domain-containing protein [Pseudonocardia sp. MH-G8]